MALAVIKGIQISGIVSVVPPELEDNQNLDLLTPEESEAIIQHTGIRYRYIASPEMRVGSLFRQAADDLMSRLNWDKDSVDVLVCVTQSPDQKLPSVSCRLHGEMGLPTSTLAFDINSGCSGFVYGLYTVSALLSGILKPGARAILCCGDLSSRYTEPEDRSVRPVFSDAVSAIAIEKSTDAEEITGYFNLQTEGSGWEAIRTDESDRYMRMNGIDVFNYSMRFVPQNVKALFDFAQMNPDGLDMAVFHQANRLINESIRKKIGIEPEKVAYTLYEYGNTGSATIPLSLGCAWKPEMEKSGWVLVSGFGVGFSMASGLIRFSPAVCLPPQKLLL